MKTFNFTHKNGDTIEAITFTIRVNGTPLNLTGAAISMVWKEDSTSAAVLTKTVGSGLTITDATGGKFKLDKQILSVTAPKTYKYEVETTISGDVKTYIGGRTNFVGDLI